MGDRHWMETMEGLDEMYFSLLREREILSRLLAGVREYEASIRSLDRTSLSPLRSVQRIERAMQSYTALLADLRDFYTNPENLDIGPEGR